MNDHSLMRLQGAAAKSAELTMLADLYGMVNKTQLHKFMCSTTELWLIPNAVSTNTHAQKNKILPSMRNKVRLGPVFTFCYKHSPLWELSAYFKK